MSYTYLLDTYAFIQSRLYEIQRQLGDTEADDWEARQHAAGQIEALRELEKFLSTRFDTKLPRRLLLQRTLRGQEKVRGTKLTKLTK